MYTWKVVQFSRFKATKDWKRLCFLWGGTTCKAEIIPRSRVLGSPAASCIQTVFGMVCSLWQKYEHRWLFQEGVQNGHDSWYIQVFYAKATLETHHHNMWQTPTPSMGWFLSCFWWPILPMISEEQRISHSYWRQGCRRISGKCLARACDGWNGFLVLSVQHVFIPFGDFCDWGDWDDHI